MINIEISLYRGIVEVGNLPEGVEVVLKDYDITQETEDTLEDTNGLYETHVWTKEGQVK